VDKIIQIHPIKTHQKTYNAIFATSGIPMAMKYYNAFKAKEHGLVIATIFSYTPNEDTEEQDMLSRDMLESAIKDYNQQFKTNYSTDTYAQYFTDISKRFKNKEIDILIVVDMFLTGFDSKLLNTLYLDKKLTMHNLIQAFSRTNRIYDERKQFGNIVSFMTRKEDVEEAIYVYSDSDNTDTVLLKPYEEYTSRAKRQVALLKTIVPNVQDVDKLEGESMQRDFIEAFKALVKTLTTLRNFIEFEFNEAEVGMSEQDYMDYKSKYLDLNRQVNQLDKVSILADISFDIELLSTDIINVDYIINLLNSLNFDNPIQMEVDIDKIKTILKQNDTDDMHSKIELLRKFIDRVVPSLTKEDNIEEKYEAFIDEERDLAIYEMSHHIGIEMILIKEMIREYQFTSVIPNDLILKHVKGKLIEKSQKMNTLREFIYEISENY
jgi:type I restriction enzyme R subunit